MYTLPLAYLITFRCYGTWLNGDARGSVDRHHNEYGTPFVPPDEMLEQYRRSLMKHPPVYLGAARRVAVREAIQETCAFRNWDLYARSVRTNHVHVVMGVGDTIAETALNALKANATRIMRAGTCWPESHSPWSSGGSTRYLWEGAGCNQCNKVCNRGSGARAGLNMPAATEPALHPRQSSVPGAVAPCRPLPQPVLTRCSSAGPQYLVR